MRVLYVVGSCLTKNTSANMSHNAYVQGLLENGCEVDILMAEDSWGQQDSRLPIWREARYYCYPSSAPQDKFRIWARKLIPFQSSESSVNVDDLDNSTQNTSQENTPNNRSVKNRFRSELKRLYYNFFPGDSLYPLNWYWLQKASQFQSASEYDLVVSNSSPAASHKLVQLLLQAERLSCKRWIQIWEDPWYADLYASRNEAVFQEEHALLSAATEVYYVSPLTLEYQKKLFPDCREKMKHIPLPYLDFSEEERTAQMSFGYFGDYYSHTRNLLPFYQALRESDCVGRIYGDSDLKLESSDEITISGRVTLDVLSEVQSKTGVLVHLCNLRGGQIPGKIYHYSATNKPILFILDGTADEKQKLRAYFGQFNRFYFVENRKDQIYKAILDLSQNPEIYIGSKVEDFSPKSVVATLL